MTRWERIKFYVMSWVYAPSHWIEDYLTKDQGPYFNGDDDSR